MHAVASPGPPEPGVKRREDRTGRGIDAGMWALTSYYNPAGYRRRRENYRHFRRRLGLPLVAVEAERDGVFDLAPGDADILVRIAGGDVMWQKERLLDIALDVLPPACRAIAWVDCDVIFGDEDWAPKAAALLEDRPLVQLYGAVHYLPPGAGPEDIGRVAPELSRLSIGHVAATGHDDPCAGLDSGGVRGMGALASGFAWAARRELLEAHRFYDACIIGAGDTAMVAAAFASPERAVSRLSMTKAQTEHYLAWAGGFGRAVAGDVGALDSPIHHLWHGDLVYRRRRVRNEELAGFGFDPFRDIAADPCGPWRWASDKPAMHRYVASYFASRREDG
ncbi:MAG: hypothetical protein KDK07_04310 [Bauldia sp.]|nr:hypothetical protein [Bauldia sp.]